MPLFLALLILFSLPYQYSSHAEPARNLSSQINSKIRGKSTSEIYNQALPLLEEEESKDMAFLILKRLAYERLFIPSYLELQKRGQSFSFLPLLWHGSLFLLALLSLLFVFLYWLKPSPLTLKKTFVSLGLFAWILGIGLVFLKPIASVIKVTSLKTTPFASSGDLMKLTPQDELKVLEVKKAWVKVKKREQSGWVKNEELFYLLETGKF